MKVLRKGSRGEDVKTLQKALNLIDDGIFGNITEEAVKVFQKEHDLEVDGIVGQKTWEALVNFPQKPYVYHESQNLKKSSRKINLIVVHCSATIEGEDYTVAEIRKWHLKRGFADIGYHYVVYNDGTVHVGRDVNKVGAHTAGYNAHSIGVCYIGGLDKNKKAKDTRNEAQKAALLELLKRLKALYPLATIHGHREFANKACPCFDAFKEYKNI